MTDEGGPHPKVIKIGAREFGGLGRAVTNAAESAGVLSKPRKGGKQSSGYGEGSSGGY